MEKALKEAVDDVVGQVVLGVLLAWPKDDNGLDHLVFKDDGYYIVTRTQNVPTPTLEVLLKYVKRYVDEYLSKDEEISLLDELPDGLTFDDVVAQVPGLTPEELQASAMLWLESHATNAHGTWADTDAEEVDFVDMVSMQLTGLSPWPTVRGKHLGWFEDRAADDKFFYAKSESGACWRLSFSKAGGLWVKIGYFAADDLCEGWERVLLVEEARE